MNVRRGKKVADEARKLAQAFTEQKEVAAASRGGGARGGDAMFLDDAVSDGSGGRDGSGARIPRRRSSKLGHLRLPSSGQASFSAGVAVEDSYEGVRLVWPLALRQVLEVMEMFKHDRLLHYRYLMEVLERARKHMTREPTLRRLKIPDGIKLTIVGDTHGQLQDLFTIFAINGLPSEKVNSYRLCVYLIVCFVSDRSSPTSPSIHPRAQNWYLFNGDFVDRGRSGCEVVCVLYLFMLLLPGCVFLNRGNHEARAQNSWMGFEDEVFAKYDDALHPDYARSVFLSLSLSLLSPSLSLSLHASSHEFLISLNAGATQMQM